MIFEEVTKANEELIGRVRSAQTEGKERKALDGVAAVYASFVEEWVQKDVDENLVCSYSRLLKKHSTHSYISETLPHRVPPIPHILQEGASITPHISPPPSHLPSRTHRARFPKKHQIC